LDTNALLDRGVDRLKTIAEFSPSYRRGRQFESPRLPYPDGCPCFAGKRSTGARKGATIGP